MTTSHLVSLYILGPFQTLFTTAAKRDSCQIVTLFVSRPSSSSLLRVKAKVLTRTASFPPCSLGVSALVFLPWSESYQRYSCVRVLTFAISDKNAFFCSSLGIGNMASSLIFRSLLKCHFSVMVCQPLYKIAVVTSDPMLSTSLFVLFYSLYQFLTLVFVFLFVCFNFLCFFFFP